jgi:hypothetical protein
LCFVVCGILYIDLLPVRGLSYVSILRVYAVVATAAAVPPLLARAVDAFGDAFGAL